MESMVRPLLSCRDPITPCRLFATLIFACLHVRRSFCFVRYIYAYEIWMDGSMSFPHLWCNGLYSSYTYTQRGVHQLVLLVLSKKKLVLLVYCVHKLGDFLIIFFISRNNTHFLKFAQIICRGKGSRLEGIGEDKPE
jgi:hypothetical protein